MNADAKKAIERATKQAGKYGLPTYVRAGRGKFVVTACKPLPVTSHWMVEADGSLSAHLGGHGLRDYAYQPVH